MNTITRVSRFIRWEDWGPGKLTILWSLCLYIVVAYELAFESFSLTFIVFLAFAATQSALGYVLNNWGDRDLDRRQFKYNPFNGMSDLECILSLVLMLGMAFVTGLPLALRPGFGILWFTWLATTAAYSLEPVRLKTKGIAGLVVSFVAQWFLPVLITFAAFEAAGGWDMWIIALALTISGATLELAHQRYDREKDKLTRAETFAARLEDVQVDRIYAFFVLLDKFAVGMVLGVIIAALISMGVDWAAWLAVSLAAVYLVLFLVTLRGSVYSLGLSAQGSQIVDPYYGDHSGEQMAARLLHQTLLNFAAPVVLGIVATLRSPLYAFVLGLFLVWRLVLGRADWLWPLKAIRARIGK